MVLDEIGIRKEGQKAFYPKGDPKDHNPYSHRPGHKSYGYEDEIWMQGWDSQALRYQQTTKGGGANKLHVETVGGNLFDLETYVNKRGWADYVVSTHLGSSGTFAQVVLRMPREMVHKLRAENRSYCAPVDHDDHKPDEEDPLCLEP